MSACACLASSARRYARRHSTRAGANKSDHEFHSPALPPPALYHVWCTGGLLVLVPVESCASDVRGSHMTDKRQQRQRHATSSSSSSRGFLGFTPQRTPDFRNVHQYTHLRVRSFKQRLSPMSSHWSSEWSVVCAEVPQPG